MDLFVNCYTNTLNTTVKRMDNNMTHVITGDIPAMWLRDSAAQLRPYIFLAKENEEIRELIAGLVRRQFMCITIDEYANAFNEAPNEYSNAIVHAFQKFKAPFSGKIVHIFPEQSAVI